MEGHVQKCLERYCELAQKNFNKLLKNSPHQVSTIITSNQKDMESDGEVSETCSQTALKCLSFARIRRPGLFCTVNNLARSVTKWSGVRRTSFRSQVHVRRRAVHLWHTHVCPGIMGE